MLEATNSCPIGLKAFSRKKIIPGIINLSNYLEVGNSWILDKNLLVTTLTDQPKANHILKISLYPQVSGALTPSAEKLLFVNGDNYRKQRLDTM